MDAAERGTAGRAGLGKGLVVLGATILVGEILFGLTQLALPWLFGAHLGWFVPAAAELSRILGGIAWNYARLLTAGAAVLVVCWPLAIAAAGARLMRNTERERD